MSKMRITCAHVNSFPSKNRDQLFLLTRRSKSETEEIYYSFANKTVIISFDLLVTVDGPIIQLSFQYLLILDAY